MACTHTYALSQIQAVQSIPITYVLKLPSSSLHLTTSCLSYDFLLTKSTKRKAYYHEITMGRNGVSFQGEVFKGMIENIAFHTMNGDKHLIIIPEGQEQTTFEFSSASRITGDSELSLPLSV